MTPEELERYLAQSGVSADTIVRFDIPAGPEHVRYVDLLPSSHNAGVLPDAVVESLGQPFAYVVRRDRLGDISRKDQALKDLLRILACRSDAKYLCVITPGAMDVFPVFVTRELPPPLLDATTSTSPSWLDLLSGAITARIPRRAQKVQELWLEGLLFELLVRAAKGIQECARQLSTEQTLALVGRALFFRFLVDRNIVSHGDLVDIAPKADSLLDVFRTSRQLAHTCKWLDRTFNGDLLSLGPDGISGVIRLCGDEISDVCWHLSNIQHRSVNGQLELDWSGIHFKHVPVDVLSQVYEEFAHEFVPELAKQTSVHFTPRRIAEVLVDGVFSAVESAPLHEARVLDPAVGGGVFLVLALRRLVAEHWRFYGKRPGRAKIRKILNSQLCGLDINSDALNVAALSLYLSALELDPKPSPIDDLKFDKLIGSVLHPVLADGSEDADRELGSLSNRIRGQFHGAFDIVLGNPPWTGWKDHLASQLDQCMAGLVGNACHQVSENKIVARYGSPDIAFLLAATGWAKPKGAIGFALHARFLFQPAAAALRAVIFASLRVTGVMNFSALRQDKWLWPTNDAPFALLVAQNAVPKLRQSFYFVSPRHEEQLEKVGQFRIDPAAAIPVSLQVVRDIPYAFKALYKGSKLGLDLIERISDAADATVKEVLADHGLAFASGYQLGKVDKRTQSTGDMRGLPEATLDMQFELPGNARTFDLDKVQWPRSPQIYEGPLLLFRESPKLDRDVRGALLCETDAVYRENFVGLSFARKSGLSLLKDLLYILSYSDMVLYYQLLTSSKFGVERDSALQVDFENFPLVSLAVAQKYRSTVTRVAKSIRAGNRCWDELDDLILKLYDLTEADKDLIKDTLATELPFTEVQRNASAPVTREHLVQFTAMFNEMILPYSDEKAKPVVRNMPETLQGGWIFFEVGRLSDAVSEDERDVLALTDVAANYWATVVRVAEKNGAELHGRLNQRRYWTRTEARQAALRWLRSPIGGQT